MQPERMTKCLIAMLLASAGALPAQSARELQLDAAASRIYVVTHRTGLLSFLGHEHVILAQHWSARLCWSAASPAASNAQFTIDARTLSIDADTARKLAGLGGGPSRRQRDQMQRKMLDAQHLDVGRHPQIRFASTGVTLANDTLRLHGRITIKGVTRDVALPVTVHEAFGVVRIAGALSVAQSAFDIRPESIAGVVKVADTVDIHVRLVGSLTSMVCAAP
jgi:polyisoprenoid-binding protein YceI